MGETVSPTSRLQNTDSAPVRVRYRARPNSFSSAYRTSASHLLGLKDTSLRENLLGRALSERHDELARTVPTVPYHSRRLPCRGAFRRRWYNAPMIATLKTMLPAIESWPAEDQRELAEVARDIEARRLGVYRASREELEGIDAGLADLRHGRIASPEAAAAMRARLRTA